MELEKLNHEKMFEIKPSASHINVNGGVFSKGRFLLGRSESCDLLINHDSVSAIHAVVEIFDDRAIIYDMNSTNGTYVNDEKILVKEIRMGDFFRLADIDFEILPYNSKTSLPPALDSLEPSHGEASIRASTQSKNHQVESLPTLPSSLKEKAPIIVYPLASDPKAEFSEYIFEDRDEIYPIFQYDVSRQAVEVIILYEDQVFSVDYLPDDKKTYFITGLLSKENEIEFPYFGQSEKFPFVRIEQGRTIISSLPGFDILHLSDKINSVNNQEIILKDQDLLRFTNNHLQIYVRNVQRPPSVNHAPFLRRDPEFRKYFLSVILLVLAFSISINFIQVPEKDKEDELAPERLATILYKRPISLSTIKTVEKTEKEEKKKQKAPKKVVVEKTKPRKNDQQIKKPDVVTTKSNSNKPDPGKRSAETKKVVKQDSKSVTRNTKQVSSAQGGSENKPMLPSTKQGSSFSQIPTKSKGHVEVYKSADFKSSISSLVAKGGSLSGIKTKTLTGTTGNMIGARSGIGSGSGEIKAATININQGSLVGATTGALADSKGADGLSAKREIFTAGIPDQTVVLGSMDPDVIRQKLIEYLPQFRSCYQRELQGDGATISGIIHLNFIIGASGHVTKSGVDGRSRLPRNVSGCVVNVLRGIVFPEPLGGGSVEVKQPMNFQPKTI